MQSPLWSWQGGGGGGSAKKLPGFEGTNQQEESERQREEERQREKEQLRLPAIIPHPKVEVTGSRERAGKAMAALPFPSFFLKGWEHRDEFRYRSQKYCKAGQRTACHKRRVRQIRDAETKERMRSPHTSSGVRGRRRRRREATTPRAGNNRGGE